MMNKSSFTALLLALALALSTANKVRGTGLVSGRDSAGLKPSNPRQSGRHTGTRPVQGNQDAVKLLLERLKASPIEADVLKAAELLSGAKAEGLEADVEASLRSLLQNDATRDFVLTALSRYAVPELEIDLVAKLPVNTDPPPPYLDKLLAALSRSGSGSAKGALTSLGSAVGGKLFSDMAVRRKIWQAVFDIDPVEGTSMALMSARSVLGPNLDQTTADFLVSLIQQVNRDRNKAVQLMPAYHRFLGSPGSFFFIPTPGAPKPPPPVLRSEGVGSPYHKIQKAIAEALLSMNSPTSLGMLVVFADSDAPDLASLAKNADYKPLEQEPWLIPTNSFVLLSVGPIPGAAGDILRKYKIGLPREMPFMYEYKAQPLSFYENNTKTMGGASPNSANALTAEQISENQNNLIKVIVSTLDKAYQLGVQEVQLPPGVPPTTAGASATPQEEYGSLRTVDYFAAQSIAKALEIYHLDPSYTLPQTLRFMLTKEWERRALVLYSIVAARRRTNSDSKTIDISTADQELDKLSDEVDPSTGILSTTVVPELAIDPHQADQFPNSCGDSKISLKGRKLSLSQGLYEETLGVTCATGATAEIKWVGAIPITLVVALRRHPRLLDFPNVSLMVRELTAEARRAKPVLDDIDYVRVAPFISIPYLAAAAVRKDVPWRHVKDTLIAEVEPRDTGAFFLATPTVLPQTDPPLPTSFPSSLQSASGVYQAAQYDAMQQALRKPVSDLANARAQRMLDERVLGALNQYLPDSEWKCYPAPCPDGKSICGQSCSNQTNYVKRKAVDDLSNRIAQSKVKEAALAEWSLGTLIAAPPVSVEVLRTFIKSDFSSCVGLYRIKTASGEIRYAAAERALEGFPRWARAVIEKDSGFLGRYRIDLIGATENATAVLMDATQRAYREDSRNMPTIELLDRTGLFPVVSYASHWSVARAPFLSTPDGRARAAELAIYDKIYEYAKGEVLAAPGNISEGFISQLRQRWTNLSQDLERQVKESADPIVKQIASSTNKGWTFGISITFGPPVPILGTTFSTANWSLGLSSSLQGNLLLTGSWNNIRLPVQLMSTAVAPDPAEPPPSPIAADAALAYVPTRMAVAGTAFSPSLADRAPAGGGTSPVITSGGAPPPATPSGVVWTQLPVYWNLLPPLDNQFIPPDPNSIERLWLSGLLFQAAPHLTADEKDAINLAVKSGKIPDSMLDMIYERRKSALEEQKIADREWIRTSVVDQLIPEAKHGQPQPVAGYPDLSPEAARDKWIEEFNKDAESRFETALSQARARAGRAEILTDGMPAIRLTYGNNFTVMQYEYEYMLAEGGTIKEAYMHLTPYWLIDHVRKDPTGHVLEKLATAATENMIQHGFNFAGKAIISKAEVKKFLDADDYREMVLKPINDIVGEDAILDKLKPAIEDFITQLTNWSAAQPTNSAVRDPFIPPFLGTPMLNFLPAPYEWAERRDEPVSQILLYQRQTNYANEVRDGNAVITGPDPVFN
jgi:hypothetical protein